MKRFTSTNARWRHKLGGALMALVGLASLGVPGSSEAANDQCGRVYLANTDNELLTLQRPAQFFAAEGATGQDRNRRLGTQTRVPIAGLADGEFLVGIDFRPSNGLLYAVGRIGADPAALGQLYTIDLDSALATAVGARNIPLNGSSFGVDFNPVPDLIRIVSDLGQNIRIRPADGIVAGTDTNLAYPAVGDPNSGRTARVVAVAYTNPDTDPQTNTVLYDVDVNRADDGDPIRVGDVLDIQVPPNGGVLNTVGRLGIDADDLVSLDIGPNHEGLAAVLPASSAFSRLYFVNLGSGDATDLGQIGAAGEQIVGLAIQLGPVCAR